MEPLSPTATNKMTCTICGWTRIIDHMRPYRGGHTKPGSTAVECHGMLSYEQISEEPIHADLITPALYDEDGEKLVADLLAESVDKFKEDDARSSAARELCPPIDVPLPG